MSMRYFRAHGGVTQAGGLTEEGLRTLLDSGYEEITAEEYAAAEAATADAVRAASEPSEEGTDGGNQR
jgi:hypothetical protein